MTTQNLKLRAPVPFPANVTGVGGISVTKANGIWTIEPAFDDLSVLVASAVGDPSSKQIWIFDPVTLSYNVLTLAGLGGALFSLTSATSFSIGAGSKAFTTQSGKDVIVGDFVLISSNAAPTTNYMSGQITAYSGTTLTVNVTSTTGSGTHTDWTIRIAGPVGQTGPSGAAGTIPTAAAGGAADVITATYSPANGSLTNNLILAFVASAANATTTPTFSPDGLTAHTIVKRGGGALVAGDIPAALAVCLVEYNLANTRWELMNPALADANYSTGLVKLAGNQALTGGFTSASVSAGTKTTGTYTFDPTAGAVQHVTNGGAHTFAPPATMGAWMLDYVNNGSAGALTTSGWTKVDGDALDTTNTHAFRCVISVGNSGSYLSVKRMV